MAGRTAPIRGDCDYWFMNLDDLENTPEGLPRFEGIATWSRLEPAIKSASRKDCPDSRGLRQDNPNRQEEVRHIAGRTAPIRGDCDRDALRCLRSLREPEGLPRFEGIATLISVCLGKRKHPPEGLPRFEGIATGYLGTVNNGNGSAGRTAPIRGDCDVLTTSDLPSISMPEGLPRFEGIATD